jgi:hypothetical protein
MSTRTLTTSRPAPARPRWALPPRLRRAVLVVHILSAAAWIGVDVMVAVLVAAGGVGDDPAVRGVAYQALARFAVTPMLAAGLTCLASGLVLGLGTKWGLVRYWWVAVKLVLNLVLCTLIIGLLRPGMAEVRDTGEALSAGAPAIADLSGLFFPPAVSLTALTVAVTLSVFKPWGRIRAAAAR